MGLAFSAVICCTLLTTKAILFNENGCFVDRLCKNDYVSAQAYFAVEQFVLIPLLITFTTRVWILFYDLRYEIYAHFQRQALPPTLNYNKQHNKNRWNEIVLNMEWWTHITEKKMNKHWILKYKRTLGSLDKFYMTK